MSDETITVDVVANPRPFSQGMQDAASATQSAGNAIDASLQRVISDVEKMAKTMNSSTSGMRSSMQDFMAQAKQVEAAMASQTKTLDELAAKRKLFTEATKAGILTETEYAAAMKTLEQQAGKIKPVVDATTQSTSLLGRVVGMFGGSVAQVQREMGVLSGELLRGNTAAFERSLITLTRQTGLLSAAFSAAGLSIAAVLVIITTIIVAIYKGYEAQNEYNKALIGTGDYAGQTASSLAAMASRVGETTGEFHEASAAVLQLAQSGRIGGEAFEEAAQGAVAFATVTGQSIDKAVDEFVKLTKDPTKNIAELNEQYHFLTLSIYDQIDALQKAGREEEASDLAIKTASDAFQDRAKKIVDNAGFIEKAWRFAKEAVGDFIDELGQIGQTGTAIEYAHAMQEKARLDVISTNKALADQGDLWAGLKVRLSGTLQSYEADRAANDKLLESLTNTMALEKEKADQEHKDNAAQTNAIAAAHAIDQMAASLDKTIKKQQELTKLKADFDKLWAGNVNGDDPRLAGVTKDDKGNFHGGLYDQLAASIEKDASAARAAARDNAAFNSVMSELNNTVTAADKVQDDLAQQLQGPSERAMKAYNSEIDKLGDGWTALDVLLANGKISQDEYNKKTEEYAAAAAIAGDKLDEILDRERALALIQDQGGDAVQRLLDKYKEEYAVIGQTDEQRDELNMRLKVEKEIRAAVTQAIKDGHPEYAAQLDDLLKQGDAYAHSAVQAQKYADANKKAAQDFMNIWKSGFDGVANLFGEFFSGQLNGWSDFGDKLVNIVKQMVGQMIAQFIQLEVVVPIMQALFGAMAGGGGGGWGGMLGMIAGAGGAASGATGGGGGGFNIGSAVGTGMQAYNLYQNGIFGIGGAAGGGAQTLGGSMFGTGDFDVGWGNMLSSGGGVGGALGTAGGVLGGYYLGQKYLGGTAGGLAGAAGIGAAAYFVPIIGWIAGAIALIDMMTGGGLLGTDATFNKGVTNLDVGAGGANLTAGIDLKGKKPLFGGSYHKWQDVPVDPAAQAAADAFFKALTQQTDSFAKSFGTTMGDIVGGQFQQTFDKHGKVTGSTTTINGKTYSGETEQQFEERLGAENLIAVLKKVGVDVTSYTNQFIADADKYAQAVQGVAAALQKANTDLKNGLDVTKDIAGSKGTLDDVWKLIQQFNSDGESMATTYARLAGEQTLVNQGLSLLTGQKTVTDIENFIRSVQQVGETVEQAYERVMQANQTYFNTMASVNQQLGQFEMAGKNMTVVGSFADSIAQIDANMNATIKTLNDAAQAAGLEGAKEEDLARVHQLAAQQVQAAIGQLVAAGQSLVDQLYGGGTLAGIEQEISALENGTHALRGFNNAITSTANAAKNAMDLMLGDLSPLNDQQKLATAMQGLRAGTATVDQVLEIGRRLYASGSQYTDLFNSLRPYFGRGGSVPNYGGVPSGGGVGDTPHGNLAELKAERDAMLKSQREAQARELAAVTANLSLVQKESYEQIADELHFNLKDLAKDLNMSQDQLKTYLDSLKAQATAVPDSLKTNFDRLIDFLGEIFGVAPPPDTTDDGSGDGSSTGTPGHSTHGTPGSGGGRSGTAPPPPTGHSSHGAGMTRGAATSDDVVTAIQENTTVTRQLIDRMDRIYTGGGSRGTRTAPGSR